MEDTKPSLSNSRSLAIARMIDMERRFKRDPKFREMYLATIIDYIKQWHAAKVTLGKLDRSSNITNTYYTMV